MIQQSSLGRPWDATQPLLRPTFRALALIGAVPVLLSSWWWFERAGAAVVVTTIYLVTGFVCRGRADAIAAAGWWIVELTLLRLGALRLVYPPQDIEYLRAGVDVKSLLFSYALWGPRYCLGYPATFIRDQFRISLNQGYALLCIAVIALVVVLIVRALELFSPAATASPGLVRTAVLVFWSLLLLFMNGRLVNCYFGMVLILLSQAWALRQRRLDFVCVLLQAAGVYLTMMSSGTMWVALTQCIGGDAIIARLLRSWHGLPWLAALVVGYLPFFRAAQQKNLSFFGGRVTAMLRHGWGAIFHLDNVLTLLLVLGLGVILTAMASLTWRRFVLGRSDCLLWFNLPVAIAGGAFGYSTGTMAIPGLVLLALSAPLFQRSAHLVPSASLRQRVF